MNLTRKFSHTTVTIQLQNEFHEIQELPTLLTSLERVVNENNEQVGHMIQSERPMIFEDVTPELLLLINSSLAHTGYKLAPIEGSDE